MNCCICDDAYDSRHMCKKCRADPANADWREERSPPKDPKAADPWAYDGLKARVVRAVVVDGLSQRAAAAREGCTSAYVKRVLDEVDCPAFRKMLKN